MLTKHGEVRKIKGIKGELIGTIKGDRLLFVTKKLLVPFFVAPSSFVIYF